MERVLLLLICKDYNLQIETIPNPQKSINVQ